MLLALSTATPAGRSNSPLPLPNEPHFVNNAPVGLNFTTWLLGLPSATNTLLPGPRASARGCARTPLPNDRTHW